MNRTQDVDCQKRFNVIQTNSMYQVANVCLGLAWIEDLERLLVDWEYENFSTVFDSVS